MPAWITIAAADLNDYLVAAQFSALKSAALGVGQTDPFPRVMADIVERVRREIQACPTNKLSATANSIPPELKTQTCYLILEAMQARLPNLRLSDDQRTLISDAKDFLRRVAQCEIPITTPDDPLAEQVQRTGDIELVTKPTRKATRDKMAGL